ncbi:MAG: substrate-binding periplasmic protein, partial [Anaerolineales bacterium]
MPKYRTLLFGALVIFAIVLAACAPAATEAPPAEEPAAEEPAAEEPAAEEPAAEEPAAEEAALPDLGGREVTIAIENAYLPFNFVSLETGEAGGWDYDFVNEACKRLNCTPVWIEFGWDTMIASVAEGQFDMAADGITITEERAQIVDFSDGYVNIEQRLMLRIDDDRYEGPDDFAADTEA